VVGDGGNFVRTLSALADRGADPKVVNDQTGRLTFASELARAILHLLDSRAPYGVYNITGSGAPATWADIARAVFRATGNDPARIVDVSTEEYSAASALPMAPRPAWSVLDLSRLEAAGVTTSDHLDALAEYLRSPRAPTPQSSACSVQTRSAEPVQE
jgi:dTDP-4-dehydrorhamnose 3,5-epimerase